jgi:hypothetical protein
MLVPVQVSIVQLAVFAVAVPIGALVSSVNLFAISDIVGSE